MTEGFGMNFYGFFVYAGVWVIGYFLWAIYTNRKEDDRGKKQDSRD